MPYEYLASVQSAVRRINDRMNKLTKELGADSPIVSDVAAKMDAFLGDNMRFKGGVAQLSRPSDIFGDEDKMNALKEIEDSLPTWGKIKKEAEPAYEKFKSQTEADFLGGDVSLADFINLNLSIEPALATLYDLEKKGNVDAIQGIQIMKEKGHKRTYEELNQMLELTRAAVMSDEKVRSYEQRYGLSFS